MPERTAAQYLIAIWLLQMQRQEQVTVTSLSYCLTMAPPPFHRLLRKLCGAGLVQHERYGPIALTAHGQHIATIAVGRSGSPEHSSLTSSRYLAACRGGTFETQHGTQHSACRTHVSGGWFTRLRPV